MYTLNHPKRKNGSILHNEHKKNKMYTCSVETESIRQARYYIPGQKTEKITENMKLQVKSPLDLENVKRAEGQKINIKIHQAYREIEGEEIINQENKRKIQIDLEDWEKFYKNKKNHEQFLQEEEEQELRKQQQESEELIKIPDLNQNIIDTVFYELEQKQSSIQTLEDYEDMVSSPLKKEKKQKRIFHYTPQEMAKGEFQLPTDVSETLLHHFYPHKNFEGIEKTKQKTLKRIVRNMVKSRMESVVSQLNTNSFTKEMIFNLGKFISYKTFESFKSMKQNQVLKSIDFGYIGKQIQEHKVTKNAKLFDFSEEEKNPRLNFKMNEAKLFKQYKDCVLQINHKEELLTDLRIELSVQQYDIKNINKQILEKKLDIENPIIGLKRRKKSTVDISDKNDLSKDEIKNKDIVIQNKINTNSSRLNNNSNGIRNSSRNRKRHKKTYIKHNEDGTLDEPDPEYLTYMEKQKIIEQSKKDLVNLEEKLQSQQSDLNFTIQKINDIEKSKAFLQITKKNLKSLLKDKYVDLLLNDFTNAQDLTSDCFKKKNFLQPTYIIQQIKKIGEFIRQEYFPEFIDDTSINYLINVADIDTKSEDLYQQLKNIDQHNKMNERKQKLINDFNKNSSKFNEQQVKERLDNLKQDVVKASIPKKTQIKNKIQEDQMQRQSLYIDELKHFQELQTQLLINPLHQRKDTVFLQLTQSKEKIRVELKNIQEKKNKLKQDEIKRIFEFYKNQSNGKNPKQILNDCKRILITLFGPYDGETAFFHYQQQMIERKNKFAQNSTFSFSKNKISQNNINQEKNINTAYQEIENQNQTNNLQENFKLGKTKSKVKNTISLDEKISHTLQLNT